MAKLVSKTYGDALFELAVEEHKETLLFEEVKELRTILKDNKDFELFMNHPKIPVEDKQEAMKNIFQGKISDELMGFLEIILNKKRYHDIYAILDYFVERMKLQMEIGTAYITTAIEINETEKEKITERLLKTTDFKELETHFLVNPKIIGGMIVKIGDKVVDSSVQTKLEKLERDLLAFQL